VIQMCLGDRFNGNKRAFYLGPKIVVKNLLQQREPHPSALLIFVGKIET